MHRRPAPSPCFVGVAAISPRLVRPLATVLGYPGRKRRRRSRTARHSERDPQPQPHRRDRRRPHGRLDAGHDRRRARPGPAKLVHHHRGAAGHGRVRRHLRERVRHVAADGRQADWQDPGSRKLERTQLTRRGSTATDVFVTGVEPNIAAFYSFRYKSPLRGRPDVSRRLSDGGAIVRKSFAEEHAVTVGSPIEMLTPSGERLNLTVSGILDPGAFDLDPLLGSGRHRPGGVRRVVPTRGRRFTRSSTCRRRRERSRRRKPQAREVATRA